jgi:hypothetical protein
MPQIIGTGKAHNVAIGEDVYHLVYANDAGTVDVNHKTYIKANETFMRSTVTTVYYNPENDIISYDVKGGTDTILEKAGYSRLSLVKGGVKQMDAVLEHVDDESSDENIAAAYKGVLERLLTITKLIDGSITEN